MDTPLLLNTSSAFLSGRKREREREREREKEGEHPKPVLEMVRERRFQREKGLPKNKAKKREIDVL